MWTWLRIGADADDADDCGVDADIADDDAAENAAADDAAEDGADYDVADGVITCHPNHCEDACGNRSKNCGRPSKKNCHHQLLDKNQQNH